ncbi:NAD(P)H-binding protein [Helicobacter sp. UBA3407]|uniref:NAD(P)H-binding protein n=1 Tax=Helicobacter TaxID=209 RepID=UPI0026365DAE|nr:NAD(P)H-binding protein [Helicobacter sp. UBA3407]
MERKYIKNYEANIALLIDYTIIRAQWFSNADEIDYELTQKGEAFKNPSGRISRKSIADLIVKLCTIKNFGIRQSLGINKPLK